MNTIFDIYFEFLITSNKKVHIRDNPNLIIYYFGFINMIDVLLKYNKFIL